jgi:hypothetical protein
MMVEEVLLEKVKALSLNRQQEVLDFAEFLAQKEAQPQPRRSLYGALADLDIKITEEDIREARQEMWGNFPREHFFDQGEEKP